MSNLAIVPPTYYKPKFAEYEINKKQGKAGRVALNVTREFGKQKLGDILFQIAIDTIGNSCYNTCETEVNITQPALCSEFGGKL
jgi:hypothetical protein